MRGMKYVAVFICMCLTFLSNGQDADNYYKIRYDQINDSVPDSVAIITGNIIGLKTRNPISHIAFQRHDEIGMDFKTAYIDYAQKKFYFRMPPQKGLFYATTISGDEIILPMKDYKNKSWTKVDFYSSDTLKPGKVDDPVQIFEEPRPNKKPVIYLYSQEKIDVSISIDYPGEFTFMYPEYKDGWDVSVDKNGIISEGKSYPYLFWEGEMYGLDFVRDSQNQIPSIQTKKKDVVKTLERELTNMGLNPKEMTDFITFWAPQMEQHEQVAIQFFRDEVYTDKIASLNVSPAPAASNRIYMLYVPVTKENKTQFVEVKTKYEPFVRSGFTLIEWGGTEIDEVELKEVVAVRRKNRGEQTCGLVQSSTMDVKRKNN